MWNRYGIWNTLRNEWQYGINVLRILDGKPDNVVSNPTVAEFEMVSSKSYILVLATLNIVQKWTTMLYYHSLESRWKSGGRRFDRGLFEYSFNCDDISASCSQGQKSLSLLDTNSGRRWPWSILMHLIAMNTSCWPRLRAHRQQPFVTAYVCPGLSRVRLLVKW